MPAKFCLQFKLRDASNLRNTQMFGTQDPYCVVRVGSESSRSRTIDNGGKHPNWGGDTLSVNFHAVDVAAMSAKLSIYNANVLKDDLIGEVDIPLRSVPTQVEQTMDLPLQYKGRPGGTLRVAVKLHYPPGTAPPPAGQAGAAMFGIPQARPVGAPGYAPPAAVAAPAPASSSGGKWGSEFRVAQPGGPSSPLSYPAAAAGPAAYAPPAAAPAYSPPPPAAAPYPAAYPSSAGYGAPVPAYTAPPAYSATAPGYPSAPSTYSSEPSYAAAVVPPPEPGYPSAGGGGGGPGYPAVTIAPPPPYAETPGFPTAPAAASAMPDRSQEEIDRIVAMEIARRGNKGGSPYDLDGNGFVSIEEYKEVQRRREEQTRKDEEYARQLAQLRL